MYADTMTDSMRRSIDETNRRRAKQIAYNQEHGITPRTIRKAIDASLVEMYSPEWAVVPEIETKPDADEQLDPHQLVDRITELRQQMMDAADKLDFEQAAELRDRIKKLERKVFGLDKGPPPPRQAPGTPGSGNDRARSQRPRGTMAGPNQTRGRRGAGAATGAAAAASQGSQRPQKLRLIPDPPK